MANYHFTRESRLLTPQQFSFVFAKASHISSCQHILILARTNELTYSRIGFVFSKKKIKTAVNRNRIRRVCRESFRLHDISSKTNLDIVCVAKQGIDKINNAELWDILNSSWQKFLLSGK